MTEPTLTQRQNGRERARELADTYTAVQLAEKVTLLEGDVAKLSKRNDDMRFALWKIAMGGWTGPGAAAQARMALDGRGQERSS